MSSAVMLHKIFVLPWHLVAESASLSFVNFPKNSVFKRCSRSSFGQKYKSKPRIAFGQFNSQVLVFVNPINMSSLYCNTFELLGSFKTSSASLTESCSFLITQFNSLTGSFAAKFFTKLFTCEINAASCDLITASRSRALSSILCFSSLLLA